MKGGIDKHQKGEKQSNNKPVALNPTTQQTSRQTKC